MRKAFVLALVPAVVVVTASFAAAADDPETHPPQTIVLHAATTAFSVLDLGQPGTSPGDSDFRKDDLTDRTGAHVGTMNSMCTNNVPAADPPGELDVLCSGAILLAAGQIQWQTVLHLTPPPPPPPPPPLAIGAAASPAAADPFYPPLAIVGGTGAYRTARGEILQSARSVLDHTLRIHLS